MSAGDILRKIVRESVICVLIHSFNKCLLRDYYVPGTALNKEDTMNNKAAA